MVGLNHLGVLMSQEGEVHQATDLIEKAIALQPDYAEAHFNLGVALNKQGRIVDAVAAFKQTLRLRPNHAEAYNNLGINLQQQEKPEEAVIAYRSALKNRPKYARAHNNLGNALRDQGMLDKAIHAYQKALEVRPGYATACDNLGIAYKEQGRLEEALRQFRSAMTHLMEDPAFKPARPKDYMDVGTAHRALLALKSGLDAERVPFFLPYGTLLGIVRDGDLLPHDKDMDVGLPWDVAREDLMRELTNSHGFSRTGRHTPEDDAWNIVLMHPETGISIDLFFFKPDGDTLLSGFNHLPVPLLWRFRHFETQPLEFLGHTWQVPNPPEQFFQDIYGSDWRSPDPYFDSIASGHNRVAGCLEVAICFAFHRLYDRLKRGEWEKADGYCAQILAQYTDPFIEQLSQSLQQRIQAKNTQS